MNWLSRRLICWVCCGDNMMARIGLLVVWLLMTLSVPGKAAPPSPIALIKTKYAEIEDVVAKNPDKLAMQAGIRLVMDTFVDYSELGRRTLPGEWENLKERQRAEFVAEFKKMIQRTYVKRFNPNRKVEIVYHGEPEPQEDGSVLVATTVRSGRSEARVDYLFHQRKNQWWAYDVIIDDVSMVKNYRKQFNDILQREGFDGLMERIRRKNAKASE